MFAIVAAHNLRPQPIAVAAPATTAAPVPHVPHTAIRARWFRVEAPGRTPRLELRWETRLTAIEREAA